MSIAASALSIWTQGLQLATATDPQWVRTWPERLATAGNAVAKNPNCWVGHYNLGIVFLQKGQVDKALEHFQNAVEINPNYLEAHSNLGLILFKKRRLDEAIAQFLEVLRLKPDFNPAQDYLARAQALDKHFVTKISARILQFPRPRVRPIWLSTETIIWHYRQRALLSWNLCSVRTLPFHWRIILIGSDHHHRAAVAGALDTYKDCCVIERARKLPAKSFRMPLSTQNSGRFWFDHRETVPLYGLPAIYSVLALIWSA